MHMPRLMSYSNDLYQTIAVKMDRSELSFKRTYEKVVCQLSSVQMGEISCRFNELYAKAGVQKSRRVLQVLEPSGSCQWVFDAFNEKKVLEDE